MPEPDSRLREKTSSVRWQGIAIEQLGRVNNLLIGLATGMIAFEGRLILDSAGHPVGGDNMIFTPSFLSLILSAGLGVLIAWNRLDDFRKTARVARLRESNQQRPHAHNGENGDIGELREEVKSLGEETWRLLAWQFRFFAFGIALFAVAVFAPCFIR